MAAILDQIRKLFDLQQLQVLCDCLHQTSLIPVKPELRNLWSHTCISHTWMQFYPFLQIQSWQPYWIKSQNCSTCSNHSVVWLFAPGFIDSRQARAEKPSSTYMHLSYLNAVLRFYANCRLAAIVDRIEKLFHQASLIQVKPELRNLRPHTWISHIWMHSFTLLCKLHHGGHIWFNWKIVPPASPTGVVWLFAPCFVDSSQARAEKPLSTQVHV